MSVLALAEQDEAVSRSGAVDRHLSVRVVRGEVLAHEGGDGLDRSEPNTAMEPSSGAAEVLALSLEPPLSSLLAARGGGDERQRSDDPCGHEAHIL